MKILRRIAAVSLAALLLVYGGDWLLLRYKVERNQGGLGMVVVNHSYAIGEKGKKTEYIPIGQENRICVASLFPHLGYSPCWYVRRHADEYTVI